MHPLAPASFVALLALLPSLVQADPAHFRSATSAEPSRFSQYTFETLLTDSVGTRHGTPVGEVTFSPGPANQGQAIVLNGNGHVNLGNSDAFDFSDGTGTVELWVRATWTSIGFNPCIVADRQDPGTRWSIHMSVAKDLLYFWNGASVVSAPIPNAGTGWHMLHVIFENGLARMAWDGRIVGTPNNALGGSPAAPTQIGSASPTGQERWVGGLDEVTFYADALPNSAIAAHWNAWQTTSAGNAPAITAQPQNQTVSEGGTANFSVTLADPSGATYRWQKNGVDLPNATSAALAFGPASLADSGATFRCIIYNAYGGVSSAPATLTVNDTSPPTFRSSAMLGDPTKIILTFSEGVNASAQNFSVSGGVTIQNASVGAAPNVIVLTVSPPLTRGTSYTITINGVTDSSGNTIAPNTTATFIALDYTPAEIALLRPAPEPPGPATRRSGLAITEIMYEPLARGDARNLEFIEIYNSLPWAEDLTGYRLSGQVNYDFPAGTTIPALGYLLVAAAPGDVQTVYGISGVLGPYEGRLDNAGGLLRLRDEAGSVAFEVEYDNGGTWPAAAAGGGPSLVLIRPSLGMNDPDAWSGSALIGGSPKAAEPVLENPWRTVVFNEVLANSAGADFIELYNYSVTPVDLSGCILSDAPGQIGYVFPSGASIPAKGFVALGEAQLGFAPHATGDTLFLLSPGGTRVLETIRFGAQEPGVASGRFPDGAPAWRSLTSPTAGVENVPAKRGDLVISEIMYHPISADSAEEFIEIENRTASTVNVGGWRLRGEADYAFPNGVSVPAGGRLVVAKDAARLIGNYPGLTSANTFGPFSGTLSDRQGRIALQRPVAYTPEGGAATTIHPEVDVLTYDGGGRWGPLSDGGGSSLELVDSRADGRLAPSWAESDESSKSAWKTIEFTGTLDAGMSGVGPNQLHVFMLGEGECLVDDVEVSVGGANLVLNGGFSSADGWTFQGTHKTSAVENGVLHIRATSRGDTGSNRIYTTLTAEPPVNQTATIRARVRWLRGAPEILFRLRGGWLEATGNMLTTAALGTPGAPNSRAGNAAPAITDVSHSPILPAAGAPVTVFARVTDADSLTSLLVQYRIDPTGPLIGLGMAPRGAGLFSASIPAQAAGALAAFRIVAGDSAGQAATFPNDAPARECLIRWGEPVPSGALGAYRFWMTKATEDEWTTREKNSNAPLDVTFIYGSTRAIYNAGAQYSGSPFHTPGFSGPRGGPTDYSLDFPSDDRLLGETSAILAGPGTFGDDSSLIREQMIWWIARKLGVPSLHRRFVRVFVNGQQRQVIFEDTQQPGGEFISQWFPGDDNGRLHKAQDWIEFANDGQTFSGVIRATLEKFTTAGGAKKLSRYRWNWAPRAVEGSVNDFTDFNALIDAHNQPAPALYQAQVEALVDVDSWMRAMAVQRIAGNWDTWGWSYGKNMYIYKPRASRWAMTPWDVDFSFGLGPGDPADSPLFTNSSRFDPNAPGDPLATKFRNNVKFRRAYWRAFSDAVNGPMAAAGARSELLRTALVAQGLTPTGTVDVVNYIAARRNYIISQLATVAADFTVAGPTSYRTDNSTITLSGTAPVGTKTITVNGVELAVVWSSATAWSASYLLAPGENTLVVRALGTSGNVIGSTTLTVTYTGTAVWPSLRINEWMATNSSYADPADGDTDDWFEIYNPTSSPVNLANWRLSDNPALPAQFIVPNGYTIPAGGRLLVWADNELAENTAGNPQLHTNFKLAGEGEALVLSAPDGTLVDAIAFGPQTENRAEGRFPDGSPALRMLTLPTPGAPNSLTEFTELTRENGEIEITFTTTPGLRYTVEESADLTRWTALAPPEIANGGTLTITDARATGARHFYRVMVEP